MRDREDRLNHKSSKTKSQNSAKKSSEELHSEISSSEDEILTGGACNNDDSQQSQDNCDDELSRLDVIPSLTFNKGSEDGHRCTPVQVSFLQLCF